MTALAAVPQPGDPHARPGNHPKEPAVTYTHIDVELVARALHNHPGDTPFDYYDDAKRALDALVAAGRLPAAHHQPLLALDAVEVDALVEVAFEVAHESPDAAGGRGLTVRRVRSALDKIQWADRD